MLKLKNIYFINKSSSFKYHYITPQTERDIFLSRTTLSLKLVDLFWEYIQCGTLILLTMDNIILSFKAKVSPCFSLILFLSRHFMAYLHYDRTNLIVGLIQVMVKPWLPGIKRTSENSKDNWQPKLKMQLTMREQQFIETHREKSG